MRARGLATTYLVALLFAVLTAPAGAQESWTIGEITAPAGTTYVRPAAVNASGVVVGAAVFPGRSVTAFRWEDGEMTPLQMPAGYDQSYATDINDAGEIVGYVRVEPDGQQARTNAVRWVGGSALLMPCCFAGDEAPNQYGSSAAGNNEIGDVVGIANKRYDEPEPRGVTNMPFLWQGGDYIALNPPEDDRISGSALQVNEAGTILRLGLYGPDRAALMTPGTKRVLEVFPGKQGLNDAGHVAGAKPFASGETQTARLWDGEGYVELAASNPSTTSMANAVNNTDWAVGRAGVAWYQPPENGLAILWRPVAPPAALQSLAGSGWTLYNAIDINDDGLTVGVGLHGEKSVGFWMAPAALAHRLDGRVTDENGGPLAGVRVRVSQSDGREVPPQDSGTTDGDGRYSWTLPGGAYRVTALPEGQHAVVANADCTISGFTCEISVSRSRTVDFQRVASTPVPVGPGPSGPGANAPAPLPDTSGPALAIPAVNKALRASKAGVVRFKLGQVAEDVTGAVSLKAGKRALGSKGFSAGSGQRPVVSIRLKGKARKTLEKRGKLKATATVTLRDAAGNPTAKTFKLTLKAPKRKR